MANKTDRLRKFEGELEDLQKWLTLGMVPKGDIVKHNEEIQNVKNKIEDELHRIEHLRQHGQPEEFITPKRQSNKLVVNDGPSISDMEVSGSDYDSNAFSESDTRDYDNQPSEADTSDDTSYDDYDSNDPFHEKNRWKKREIIDPEADDW